MINMIMMATKSICMLAVALVVCNIDSVTSMHTVRAEYDYYPPDFYENIATRIDDGETLKQFRMLNKASNRFVRERFPGGRACKPFYSKMKRIDRSTDDTQKKRVAFSDMVMTDLLTELITNDAMKEDRSRTFKPQWLSTLNPGERIYKGLEMFHRCLNRLTSEGYRIQDLKVDDMLEFQRMSELGTTPRYHDPSLNNRQTALEMIPVILMRSHIVERTLPRALVNALPYSNDLERPLRLILPSRVKANFPPYAPLYYIEDEEEFQELTEAALIHFRKPLRNRTRLPPRVCRGVYGVHYQAIASDNEKILSALMEKGSKRDICQCKEDAMSWAPLEPNVAKWFDENGC